MIQELVHKSIVQNCDHVDSWFKKKREGLAFPFYSSFDIRDASYKVAPVDANIFPAGFNNICQVDKDQAVDLVENYLESHYPQAGKDVVILAEEHTKNPYYWENVRTLEALLKQADRDVVIAIPRKLNEPLSIETSHGGTLSIWGAELVDGEIRVKGEHPSLVICNNDFSVLPEDWSEESSTIVNPPSQMGWYRRRKDEFFTIYNELCEEFSQLIQIDPWTLKIPTERFVDFDLTDESSRERLAQKVQEFIDSLRVTYQERGITEEPFAFIKNNKGTYGLGIVQARSGEDVLSWSYKSRKKMKASKGGQGVSEVIIQEGIPTFMTSGEETSEPVIYMVGCQLAGGFLRAHSKKGPQDNLNSPGAVFKRLCVSDLNVNVEGCPMENVYGWIAKLGLLAIAEEARAHGVEFKGYR